MNNKAILFDLDGTLVHTLPDLAEGINHMLSKRGVSAISEETINGYIGDGIFSLVKRTLPENTDDTSLSTAVADFREYYFNHLFDRSVPYPGMTEAISRLKADGFLLAAVSNKLDAATKLICNRFFPELDIVVGSSDSRPIKPAPDMPEYALLKLNTPKERAVFVGDSDVDVKTAQNCGIECVAVSWGYRTRSQLSAAGVKYIASDTAEMYNIIKSIYRLL